MKEKSVELSFYKHRTEVLIEGFRIDRLINKAHSAGITLRNLRIISDTEAAGWIASSDLKRLQSMAGQAYRITVTAQQGPEYRLRRGVKKPAAVAGVILASAIAAVQSLFIGAVEINGYRAVPEDSLRLCLEQAGISEGAYRPGIDWDGARQSLRTTFPQLIWIQLVYDGRTVILNVQESDKKILSSEADPDSDMFVPSTVQDTSCVSIVADRDCYIEKISTLWGAAMAEAGDFVKKGDVLISGIVAIEPTTFREDWPTEYYVHAKGEITGLVPYRLTFYQERYVEGEAEHDKNIVSTRREKTSEEAEKVLKQQIRLWKKENLPENAEIVNESLKFSYKNNIIEVGMTLEVRQQIGIEKEILVGQENSDN